jgi:hypothetical protein
MYFAVKLARIVQYGLAMILCDNARRRQQVDIFMRHKTTGDLVRLPAGRRRRGGFVGSSAS